MVDLIPTQESVMDILKKTEAYREGHFVYRNGKRASHYFQMPLALRFYDNAKVLAVGLSRKFRMKKTINRHLPKVAIISPSSGGIPVAFGIREALSADQIYWTEVEDGKRQFRQYVERGDFNECIIVDDIIRSGTTMRETFKLVEDFGAKVVGFGSIVKLTTAPNEINGIEPQSLVEFDCNFYDTAEELKNAEGVTAEEEEVRF
jgi:orotate phosphoribosyltransferase